MPLSDCEVRDPRIRRTRQLLQGALSGLLQTRNFEEISVQEIAEAATVNRATFYDHYNDKFALLDALIAGGFHTLLHERSVRYDESCPSAASAIILAACDYQVLMHQRSHTCDGKSPFEPLIDAAIVAAIRRILTQGPKTANSVPAYPGPASYGPAGSRHALHAEMVFTAAAGAIYGASKEWFRTPGRPPVELIVPEILAMVLPMLQSAAAPQREPDQSSPLTPLTPLNPLNPSTQPAQSTLSPQLA